jgi:hypothetical protein
MLEPRARHGEASVEASSHTGHNAELRIMYIMSIVIPVPDEVLLASA